MDRNTLTGFILIALIFVGMFYLNKPSEAQLEEQRQQRERIEQAELQAVAERHQALLREVENTPDSVQIVADRENRFGVFVVLRLNRNNADLNRRKPEREYAREMLYQYAHKPFKAAVNDAVDKNRRNAAAVAFGV